MLENYHLAEAFRILKEDECDIFDTSALTSAMKKEIRESIIVMVLATDMQAHVQVISESQAVMSKSNESNLDI